MTSQSFLLPCEKCGTLCEGGARVQLRPGGGDDGRPAEWMRMCLRCASELEMVFNVQPIVDNPAEWMLSPVTLAELVRLFLQPDRWAEDITAAQLRRQLVFQAAAQRAKRSSGSAAPEA